MISEEIKEKNRIRARKWKKNNKDKIKEYYENNKEVLKEKRKEYNKEYQKKDSNKEYQKNYRERNKEYFKNYREKSKDNRNIKNTERRNRDPFYKLKCNLRSSISKLIKNKGYLKKSKTFEILGCSYEDFIIHIEKKFESWMNWENYGNPKDDIYEPNKTWDIDHIIPLSSFNTEQELLELNHYTNLQPLCSYENRWVKKDKF